MSDANGPELTSELPNVPTVGTIVAPRLANSVPGVSNIEAVMAPLKGSSEQSTSLDELPVPVIHHQHQQLISSAPSSVAGSETPGSASYKDMLENVKKLYDSADKLHERVSRLHCKKTMFDCLTRS